MLESLTTNTPLFLLLIIWTLYWKGMALWVASKADQKKWFVALLVINTFGVLELFYLYLLPKIQKKGNTENTKEVK